MQIPQYTCSLFGDGDVKQNDLRSVEVVHDLCAVCDGHDLIVIYLVLLGYEQIEIARLMGVSRQAIDDRLKHVQERYHAGKRKHIMGRPRKTP